LVLKILVLQKGAAIFTTTCKRKKSDPDQRNNH